MGICFAKRPGIGRHSSSLSKPRVRRIDSGDKSSAGSSGYSKGVIEVVVWGHSLVVGRRERASRHLNIHCLRDGLIFLRVKTSIGFSLV